jgi:hypothetical protein
MTTEKRLIDANALRKRMFSYYSCVNENSSKEYYRGETLMNYEVADLIEDCIDEAQTVDAVPVVRCKDCNWHTGCQAPSVMFCKKYNTFMAADDFCSYGERRTDNA